MANSSSVTAIKGNTISGSLAICDGINNVPVTLLTDFQQSPWKELGLAQSSEGITVDRSADSNVIVAWGDQEIDEIFSNNVVNVTINLFSFKDLTTLQTLFGKKNVKREGNVITVSGKGMSSAEKNSIAIIGVDKLGLAAILYCEIAAVDPNFSFTWNDTDPVAIPAVFKLYKNAEGEFFQMLLEEAEEDETL